MPFKKGEETPHQAAENMSDETRKKVFGGSGAHQGPGRLEGDEENPGREYSGVSESGSGKRGGRVQKTVD